MNQRTISTLNTINRDFYDKVAEDFSATRQKPWQGWTRLLGHIETDSPKLAVLDVGCGTGTHLALYSAIGCGVTGVDLNPDMLARAASRLGSEADLREADATDLPFDDETFDVAIGMLVLHEMSPSDRSAVLCEMARVARRVLVIDHHPRHDGSLRGRAIRAASTAIERIAGGDHYRNYRQFIRSGGIPAVVGEAGRGIVGSTRRGSGSMGIYLLG